LIYQVRHKTTYDYEDPVSVSHHILRLTPHNSRTQTCRRSEIQIIPRPATRTVHTDYFGNEATEFTLLEPHERLIVDASSELEVKALPLPDFADSPPWESVRDSMPGNYTMESLNAYQFVFDSKRVKGRPELGDYARESFPERRPLLEAVLDLTRRINQDFRFDTKATEVSTPVETFFEKRGRLPGLFASANCLHAVAGIACAICERLPAHVAAAGKAQADRRRRVARVVRRMVPGRGVGGFRPDE